MARWVLRSLDIIMFPWWNLDEVGLRRSHFWPGFTMKRVIVEVASGPTFVALQAQSSGFTSGLSRASSKPSPLPTIAGIPANGTPEGLAPAHGPLMSDEDGDIVIGITCMLLVLCTMAVVARILARRISKLRLEADDYLALIGLVS